MNKQKLLDLYKSNYITRSYYKDTYSEGSVKNTLKLLNDKYVDFMCEVIKNRDVQFYNGGGHIEVGYGYENDNKQYMEVWAKMGGKSTTFYHEFGHLIDFYAISDNRKFIGYTSTYILPTYNKTLNELLKEEAKLVTDKAYDDIINEYRELLDKEFGAGFFNQLETNAKKREELMRLGRKVGSSFVWKMRFGERKLNIELQNRVPTKDEIDYIFAFNDAIKNNYLEMYYDLSKTKSRKYIYDEKYTIVLDAIEFNKNLRSIYGLSPHGQTYYKRNTFATGEEFFANMFCAEAAGQVLQIETAKKYLPKSCDAFYEFLNCLIQHYTSGDFFIETTYTK